MVAVMASSSVGRRPSGQRWLPGTSRVAPLASVKSQSAHMLLTTTGSWGRVSG